MNEKRITQLIYFYNQLKKFIAKKEAIKSILDGAGEVLAAKTWVPYYSTDKAFIAYISWYENRINGENVKIESFTD